MPLSATADLYPAAPAPSCGGGIQVNPEGFKVAVVDAIITAPAASASPSSPHVRLNQGSMPSLVQGKQFKKTFPVQPASSAKASAPQSRDSSPDTGQ
jgi:hypothetical protein